MAQPEGPVAVEARGCAIATSVAWRQGDQLYVTVVVRAAFALVPEASMVPVEPDPMTPDDDTPSQRLRTAGDLAPYLPRADVWVSGRARATTPPPYTVRLGVFRDGAALISKSVTLADPQIVGIGLLPRRPLASLGITGAPRFGAGSAVAEIPAAFDWSGLQVTPPDQRIDAVRGDEWIVLGGVSAEAAILRSRIPGARAAAMLFARADGRPGWPIPLFGDSIHVDVERSRADLTWRGRFPVSGPDAFDHLSVVAGVEINDRPPRALDEKPAAPPPREPAVRTSVLHVSPPARPATPFERGGQDGGSPPLPPVPWSPPAPPERAKPPATKTAELRYDDADSRYKPATPFEVYAAPPRAAPPAAVAPPELPAPEPPAPEPPADAAADFLEAAAKAAKEGRLSPTERLAARGRRRSKDP